MNSTKHIPQRVVELDFSDPQMDVVESTAQINLFHSGIGSGKTFIIGYKNFQYAKLYPHVRGFIAANTYKQLNQSTLVGVFKFWGLIGLRRNIDYVINKQPPENFKIYGERLARYEHTISFSNGKLIFLGSLDNYEAIDGIEFAHADLDETKDTAEEAVKEVILGRMRQKGLWINKRGEIITDEAEALENDYFGFNPLNIYTSPAKTDWIAEWFGFENHYDEITDHIFSKTDYFRKRVGNKLMVISSTYHNEQNLPKGYIEEKIIEPNLHNEHRMNMLLYGSPIGKTGNEYYNRFERIKHVKDIQMPEDSAVHVSFDFNRGPYITSGLYKTWYDSNSNKWIVHKFAEVCLLPPNNTVIHLCDEILRLFSHMFSKGVFIYGDFSGNNKRTNSPDTDYDVIKRKFAKYLGNTSYRVIVNQDVVSRKEFMNRIFYGSLPIEFTMSTKCVYTIKDCEYLMEAPDGGKVKKKDKDGNEKYGHCSDEMEYFFTSCFKQYFKLI
jgi:hypothetical protein